MSMAPACLDCTRSDGSCGAWVWVSRWAVSGGWKLTEFQPSLGSALRSRLHPGGHARDLIHLQPRKAAACLEARPAWRLTGSRPGWWREPLEGEGRRRLRTRGTRQRPEADGAGVWEFRRLASVKSEGACVLLLPGLATASLRGLHMWCSL